MGTDTIALSNTYTNATTVTATYTWKSDIALETGTTIEIAMPGFSGTAATTSNCQSAELTFNIANTGTSANYKVTLTTAGATVTTGTDCEIVITGLTNPSSSGSPSYLVGVYDDQDKSRQPPTVPDTVTNAAIFDEVVLTDTL